jgi:triacylglycerol lipase
MTAAVLLFAVLAALLVLRLAWRPEPPRPPPALDLAPPPPLEERPLEAPLDEPEPPAAPSEPPPSYPLVATSRRLAPPPPPWPVVFAHGMGGWDEVRVLGVRTGYFRGVRERVPRRVLFASVPAFARVSDRAESLAEQLRKVDAERVHVVAHSMGGLDARWAIAHLGLASKVASLTTIGTPHRGTPLADAGAKLVRRSRRLEATLAKMGIPVDAFDDLSVSRMRAFNRDVPDSPGVRYGSYVAVPRRARDVAPPLWPAYALLAAIAGDNDGLVPAWSQPWGELMGVVDTDHWGAVGWSRGFDAAAFYEGLVEELASVR